MKRLSSIGRAVFALVLSAAVAACSSSGSLPGTTGVGAPVPSGKKIKSDDSHYHSQARASPSDQAARPLRFASTKSLKVAIAPGGQTFNVGLDASNSQDCPAVAPSVPLVCSVNIFLAPGSYTGAFSTYDGPIASGNVTGNELSANQSVPMTIVDGIPATVALVPGADSSLTGNMMAGFTGTKCGNAAATASGMTESVDVLGKDAQDNTIFGPGAPTPSLSHCLTRSPQGGR